MYRGKNGAGRHGGHARFLKRVEKAARQIGIERHLLQETEREVTKESLRLGQMKRKPVVGSEA